MNAVQFVRKPGKEIGWNKAKKMAGRPVHLYSNV